MTNYGLIQCILDLEESHKRSEPVVSVDFTLPEFKEKREPVHNPIPKKYTPRKVIFNAPATIVFWEDGTKTIVKCTNEDFDKEKGLAMALVKKMYGNTGAYYDLFKKFCTEEEK